ncbi:ribonuclease III domain protein [Talaromyces proteolyticus]|uniref:Large ribosomal subunit protein mL44 n=1 Tax=Talaromyces proteolyticus TaxID=1131652 RepID=A0AAD4KSI6_9EURO|nr:ribonuclease III domain protein [Talaromyces proteolyticus]KAH8698416.1 ribonuclease III domain protein [Talaromyces proteolyticus]
MKRLQLQRWSRSVLSPRTTPGGRLYRQVNVSTRWQSTASAAVQTQDDRSIDNTSSSEIPHSQPQHKLKYPHPTYSLKSLPRTSPKLFALHARLALPKKLPIETLARALIDASADPYPKFNNHSLSVLGHDLLALYTTEYLICAFPRLPSTVLFAAVYAYMGPKTLAAISHEWGLELAAAPGKEVDPGLLQFKRVAPGTEVTIDPSTTTRPIRKQKPTITASIVYSDAFGEPSIKATNPKHLDPTLPDPESIPGITAEAAQSTFVQAVMGAIYLHAGLPAAKRFFEEHILSRHLDISKLFSFTQPTRDLARLCARENFEPPVAKIISETGRHSRSPVFIVGVFSGQDKLGEGTGASLVEARTRAAIAALKGWYLYSPLEVRVPSSMEEPNAKPWKPVYVDWGEVFV